MKGQLGGKDAVVRRKVCELEKLSKAFRGFDYYGNFSQNTEIIL